MIICKTCGALLPDGSEFCTTCGSSINKSEDLERTTKIPILKDPELYAPEADQFDATEIPRFSTSRKQIKRVEEAADGMISGFKDTLGDMAKASEPINIRLAEGEVIVREYEAARHKLFLPSTNGMLIVTNKRVLFCSSASGDRISSSVPIHSAGVITVYNGTVMNPLFALMALAGIILVLANLNRYGHAGMIILGIVLAIVGIVLMNVPSLYLSIGTTNSSPGMVIGKPNIIGSAMYAFNGYGGRDINLIMNELGALILDLQQMGDKALEKWVV